MVACFRRLFLRSRLPVADENFTRHECKSGHLRMPPVVSVKADATGGARMVASTGSEPPVTGRLNLVVPASATASQKYQCLVGPP